MPNETEIAALVVRLTGDGSVYQKMLQQAQAATTQVASVVESTSKRIEEIGSSLKSFGSNVVSALGSFGATKFLKNAFGMFVETETILVKLASAIELNGREAAPAVDRYKEFAKEIKDLTGNAPNTTLALVKQAELMGLSGTNAEKAAKDAIGLSTVMHGSAEHFLMVAKAIQEGNAHMIHRIPLLRGIKDENLKLQKAQEFADKGFKQASVLMGTTEGVMKKFQGTLKAITKQFGEAVASGVKPAVIWLTGLVEQFTKLDPYLKKIIVGAAFLVAGILALGPAIALFRTVVFPILSILLSTFSLLGIVGAAAIFLWVQSVGGVEAAWKTVVDAVKGFTATAYGAVVEFIQQNELLIWGLGLTAGAILTAIIAFKVLSIAIGIASSIASFFYLQTIASWVATLLWSLALLALKGALILFNITFALFNFLLSTSTIGTVLWVAALVVAKIAVWAYNAAIWVLKASMAVLSFFFGTATLANSAFSFSALASKVATWLLNAAVATLNALLTAGIGIVLAIVAVLLLFAAVVLAGATTLAIIGAAGAAAMVTIWAAAMTAWGAIKDVLSVLQQMPTTSGPLKAISSIFKDWGDILREVWKGIGTNSQQALLVLQTAFQLAISRIQDLWPPLWEFIKTGSGILWRLITALAQSAFVDFWEWLKVGFSAVWEWVKTSLVSYVLSAILKVFEFLIAPLRELGADVTAMVRGQQGIASQVIKETASMQDAENKQMLATGTREAREAAVERARNELNAALGAFNVIDSEKTKRLQENLDREMATLRRLNTQTPDIKDARTNRQENLNKAIEKTIKLTATEFGSAEALGRIAEYREKLAAGFTPTTPTGTPAGGEGKKEELGYFATMVEKLTQIANNPAVILQGAGLT